MSQLELAKQLVVGASIHGAVVALAVAALFRDGDRSLRAFSGVFTTLAACFLASAVLTLWEPTWRLWGRVAILETMAMALTYLAVVLARAKRP
jgi:hypothetical protein